MKLHSSRRDEVLEGLAEELERTDGPAIWIADEQSSSEKLLWSLRAREAIYVSSRIDQVEVMRRHGIKASFNDFDFSRLEERFRQVFIRVPKQRALMHYLLNSASSILDSDGILWLAGRKNEGIKTHIQRAEECLGTKAEKIKSAGGIGIYRFTTFSGGTPLEDDDYGVLRRMELIPGESFWSKPGIFGWDKIDQGSRALLEILRKRYDTLSEERVLDLGCGYGYLARHAWDFGPDRLVATDNHAGAIQAAEKNLPVSETAVEVIASDCGDSIAETFSLILCNPPFHQGFDSTSALHQKFFTGISRLLAPKGRALVVLNSFFRIDHLCQSAGLQIKASWNFHDSNFTVFELSGQGSR